MSKTPKQASISETVMQEISVGKIAMHSRTYFMLLSGLVVATVVAAGVALAYVSSIAYFWWRIVTADGMAYGARARLSDALAGFPWWLVLLALGLGVAAVVLVRRRGRLYRHRPSTVALILVAASLLLAVVLASLNIGQPYAQQHAPMMQRQSQQLQQGRGLHRMAQ